MRDTQRSERREIETRRRGLSDLPIIGGFFRQLRLILILLVVIFGSAAACAIFAPLAFQNVINIIRNSGYDVYVQILGTRGEEALKVITYDVDVTAIGNVNRDMGALGLVFGEGATVQGTVRVSLGADLKNKRFGVLSCDVDTSTIRTSVGRAPLAGRAFDSEQIEQQAYTAFKESAAKQAIDKYWATAKAGLDKQFTTWALGLEVPRVPTLTACPTTAKQ
jgi:hypothetical protein